MILVRTYIPSDRTGIVAAKSAIWPAIDPGHCLRSARPASPSHDRLDRALCVEEGWPSYGVSAELAARIQHACFDDLDAPVERVGMAEVPLPYAKELELAAMPTEDRIERAVLQVLDLAA
jgi:pyruvate dehydrogenase E1 component beta subunit